MISGSSTYKVRNCLQWEEIVLWPQKMHHNQNHKKDLFKCPCQVFYSPLETSQWILLSECCVQIIVWALHSNLFFLLHLRGENLLSLWTSSKHTASTGRHFNCFLWLTNQSWCITTMVVVTNCFCCSWASCAEDGRNLDWFPINFYQHSVVSGVCPCSDCTKQCYRTSDLRWPMLLVILKVVVVTAKCLLYRKNHRIIEQ